MLTGALELWADDPNARTHQTAGSGALSSVRGGSAPPNLRPNLPSRRLTWGTIAVMVTCAGCGAVIDQPSDTPADERMPCQVCGSTARVIEMEAAVTGRGSISASPSVERGINDARLGILALLVGIALGAGALAAPSGWPVAVLVGLGAMAATAALIRWPRSRHLLMEAAHRLTGR